MDFRELIIEEFSSSESKLCLETEFERVTKDEDLAKEIRVSGSEMFIDCKHGAVMHERIWDAYLLSIALSPNGSESLATSYAHMSALMFHLHKYQECIDNIERALKFTQSNYLKVKLLCRKAKSLSALGLPEKNDVFEEAKSWLLKIDDTDEKWEDLVKLVRRTKIILNRNNVKVKRTSSTEINDDSLIKIKNKKKKNGKNVKKANSEFEHLKILAKKEKESIFESVDVSYNDEYCSHLVAKRDIKAGEIIFVVKPYVLVPQFAKAQNYCNNCLNTVWTGIPCENCASCMYCSEKCKNEATEKYHNIECPILPAVVSGDTWMDYYIQSTLRAVIMGVNEFGSIENLRNKINNVDGESNNVEDYNNFYQNSFMSILGFKNIYVEPKIMSELTKACCKIVICLTRFTSFFENDHKFNSIEDIIENEDTVFIGILLLWVAVIACNNSTKVSESGMSCEPFVDSSCCASETPCCEKGYSLNAFSQFIPHSCDPNVKSIKINGSKELYYAVQPIYEGNPLFECYKSTFFELSLKERNESIIQILNRDCSCVACYEDWPALLLDDEKEMIRIDDAVKIVVHSREHNNQKERFLKLLEKHNLFHQDIVDELSRIMEVNYNYFEQPSIEVCATIHLLQYVFKELYGLKSDMPDTCKIGTI